MEGSSGRFKSAYHTSVVTSEFPQGALPSRFPTGALAAPQTDLPVPSRVSLPKPRLGRAAKLGGANALEATGVTRVKAY